MPAKSLQPVQKELLLEWIAELADPVTIKDIALKYDVHAQTARLWVNQLRDEGLMTEHPMRRGRELQFIRTKEGSGEIRNGEPSYRDPDDVAIRMVRGKDQITPAEFSLSNLQNASMPRMAAAITYLFVRSYFADMPDHQHLRGTTPAIEVRAFLAEILQQTEKDMEVLRQLISFGAPWRDDGEFAMRFGNMTDLNGAMQVAQQFEALMNQMRSQ